MMGPSLILFTVLTALSFPISEYETVQFEDHSPEFIRLSLSLSEGTSADNDVRCERSPGALVIGTGREL